jgi:hypothetical protein
MSSMILSAFVTVSILWAVIALAAQVLSSSRGNPRDHGRRAGSPLRGVLYNFTVAMTPAHKESVRSHPAEFGIGVVLHAGALLALLMVVLSVVRPGTGVEIAAFLRPLFVVSMLAGGVLFVRRLRSANLRAMSAPDDYVAILATCGLLVFAAIGADGSSERIAFLIYAGLFLLYFPLGKLRHAVFFFVARGDVGRRLGYRGVYPAARAEAE